MDRRHLLQGALVAGLLPSLSMSARTNPAGVRTFLPVPFFGRRPTLWVVLTDHPGLRYYRGIEIGAVLDLAEDEVLAALSLCELSFAGAAVLASSLGLVLPDDVWFVLREPDGTVRTAAVAPASPGPGAPPTPEEHGLEGSELDLHRFVRSTGRLVVDLVVPDGDALARYAAAAGLGSTAALGASGWEDEEVRRTLARTGRDQWVDRPIPGSRWMIDEGGCNGRRPESPDLVDLVGALVDSVIPPGTCGMAYVPVLTRRVLQFL